MKRAAKSFGHAVEGLLHALKYERNLRLFVLGHTLVVSAALLLRIDLLSILLVTIMAGFFVVTELVNTAIERVTDTFDDHLKSARGGHEHPGVKMAKDVGSAASLIALLMYGAVLLLTALPYIFYVIAHS